MECGSGKGNKEHKNIKMGKEKTTVLTASSHDIVPW